MMTNETAPSPLASCSERAQVHADDSLLKDKVCKGSNADDNVDDDIEDSQEMIDKFVKQSLMKRFSSFWPSERTLLIRHPSLELLVPAHDCESRQSSTAIAIFNLVATVCGGGVLSLPYAFSRAGLIPSCLLMLFAAGITNFSMYILCSCARRTGGRSYGDVMRNAFGPVAEIGATILLCFLLFFVLVAYMVLMKDIWTPVVLAAFPNLKALFYGLGSTDQVETVKDEADMTNEASHYMLVVLLACAVPLILQTDLHALRHTCYVGFVSAVILTLGVIQQAILQNIYLNPGIFWEKVIWVGDLDGIMYAFPIIVLSFFSIFNVLTVHGALFNPTRSRVKFVLDGTIGICLVLFLAVGLCGYLFAYDETKDNILLNFPLETKSILLGRIGYGVTIMFGLPLVFLPCRASILSLPEQLQEWQTAELGGKPALKSIMKGTKHHVANSLTFDEECPLFMEKKKVTFQTKTNCQDTETMDDSWSDELSSKDISYETFAIEPVPTVDPSLNHEAERDRRVHVISTAGILVSSYFMAVGVPGVGVVWSIVGSSMAIIIGFTIPAACYIKIRSKKHVNPRSVGAWFLLAFSIVSSIVCTARTLGELSSS